MIPQLKGKYQFLSNFYPHSFLFRNIRCPTAEHAFQMSKTENDGEMLRVLAAPTPGDAKRIGQTVELREGWEEMKIDVMREVVRAKFQDPEMGERLLATGEEELVEGNTWGDTFWGVFPPPGQWREDGVMGSKGENWLGVILMEVREELR
jgi:ribA/ribD-fused uncharacterized protein